MPEIEIKPETRTHVKDLPVIELLEDISRLSVADAAKMLAINPDLVPFFNCSEAVLVKVASGVPNAIKHIALSDQTEPVQAAAVKRWPENIIEIAEPSGGVRLLALQTDGRLIKKFIERHEKEPDFQAPTDNEWIAAVAQNGFAIQSHPNPSEELQVLAVTQNIFAVSAIANPCEAAKEKVKEIEAARNAARIKSNATTGSGNSAKERNLKSDPTEMVKIAIRNMGPMIKEASGKLPPAVRKNIQ